MLRLRKCILSRLLSPSSPCTPSPVPIFPFHRLLSTTAAPFAVKDYLVATCHLTPSQALKASKVLSHLKSPSGPDAVLSFLSGSDLGLSNTDIAAVIAKDPKLLCSGVERTLAPRLADLQNLGLSPSQIARFVLVAPANFRNRAVVPILQYHLNLLGSFDNLLQVVRKSNNHLLRFNIERVVGPNVAFLMGCGLGVCDIAKLCHLQPRLISSTLERLRAMVELAQAVGVPRGTRMFKHALVAVAFLSEEKMTAQMELLKKTFRWSDAEARLAVSKLPILLRHSKDRLFRLSEFLFTQVGLEPEYIAYRPALLTYSLERRLMPRHYVVKFLKKNGLLTRNHDYYAVAQVTENVFVERFICPYKEAAPTLAQDYASACRGEVPTAFRLQEVGNG